jgi:hypothetical protein
MRGKDIVLIIISIIAFIELIIILLFLPVKVVEDVKEQPKNEWSNITTYKAN